jgi:hypothetical protein
MQKLISFCCSSYLHVCCCWYSKCHSDTLRPAKCFVASLYGGFTSSNYSAVHVILFPYLHHFLSMTCPLRIISDRLHTYSICMFHIDFLVTTSFLNTEPVSNKNISLATVTCCLYGSCPYFCLDFLCTVNGNLNLVSLNQHCTFCYTYAWHHFGT